MIDLIKKLLGLLLIAGVGFALGLGYARRTARKPVDLYVVWDPTEVVKHDTIVRERPVFVTSYVRDTVRTYFTTILHDTVTVDVPIERKVYQEDSLYRAVVSGPRCGNYEPSLDSLVIYPTTTTITIREREKIPASRWSVGATVGPSVIATPKGALRAGLGVTAGLSYRF